MGGLTALRVVAIRNRRVPTALKVNQRACGKPALIPAQAKAEDGTYVPISTRVAQCKSCDDGEPVGRALLPTFDVSGLRGGDGEPIRPSLTKACDVSGPSGH